MIVICSSSNVVYGLSGKDVNFWVHRSISQISSVPLCCVIEYVTLACVDSSDEELPVGNTLVEGVCSVV